MRQRLFELCKSINKALRRSGKRRFRVDPGLHSALRKGKQLVPDRLLIGLVSLRRLIAESGGSRQNL